MKLINYKKFVKINESKEYEYIEYSEHIISKIKEQNNIVEIIEDKMLSIMDIYGHLPPIFGIRTKEAYDKKWGYYPLITKEEKNFYQSVDGYEYEEEQSIKDIAKMLIENGYFILTLNYIFASLNDWKYVSITDDFEDELEDLQDFCKSNGIDLDLNREHITTGGIGWSSRTKKNEGVWSLEIHIPIKFQLDKKISKYDNLPKSIVSDFESFIKDYNIDEEGKSRLSDLIRRASLN